MAMENVENMPAVVYHGITVYHTYKDDFMDQPIREFTFTLDPYGSELSEDAFDIRDQAGYDPKKSTAANLLQMIDADVFGETNVLKRAGLDLHDIYGTNSTKSGLCPACRTKITEYGEPVIDYKHHEIQFSFICKNCGVSGWELAEMVFDGFAVP